MKYTIKIPEKLEKNLRKIAKNIRSKVINEISNLEYNPRPLGVKKLKGPKRKTFYRIRIADYIVIYSIKDNLLQVLVVDVGHRKSIYKEL